MPIIYKTFSELVDLGIAKIKPILPSIDKNLKNNFTLGILESCASYGNEILLTLRDLLSQTFAQTAQGELLDQRGEELGIPRPSAENSRGNISIGGVASTLIPSNSEFKGENEFFYKSVSNATISTQPTSTQNITQINRVSNIATVTTPDPHNLLVGRDIVISGTTSFDGIQTITSIISETEFTFESIGGDVLELGGSYTFDTILSLVRENDLVTVTTLGEHTLSSNLDVTIAGLTGYDGTYTITVISNTQFTFIYTGITLVPFFGGTYTSTYASVDIKCTETGSEANIENGSEFAFTQTPPVGADSSGFAQFFGIVGGAAEATDDEYRNLILLGQSTINGVQNNSIIEILVKSISGNTRVWIKNPKNGQPGGYLLPKQGQYSIFFVRDNDTPITPPPSIIEETKQIILNAGILPDMWEEYIFVQAPQLIVIDFEFLYIQPDTPTMRTAIANNIKAFFEDSINFEQITTADSYRGAIINTIDPITSEVLLYFELKEPTGDIGGSNGTLLTVGEIIFPS